MVFGESVSCSVWQIGGEGSVLGVFVFKRKEKIKDCYFRSSATLVAIVLNSKQKNQFSYCSHKLRDISSDSPHLLVLCSVFVCVHCLLASK